ncbi:MAG: ABC transporter ATP-binding protein [Candidatus Sericytochromatia bacterium]|nr:ABC transporter ATP-binding protein [Candidatus Sericytochromatia bacterium]
MQEFTAHPSPVLLLERVSRQYIRTESGDGTPVAALAGVSLAITAGEMVALMGPSGCGKSTLLHLAGLLDQPDEGAVWIEGRNTRDLDDDALTLLRRHRVGFVSQFFNLLPTLSAGENVALPLVLAGKPGKEVQTAVASVLEQMGIGSLGHRYPHEMSGGQMQRVAIARAIVHAPALLIADEPTGSLDSASGQAVLRAFQALNANTGQTILLATHAAEAAQHCHRVVKMRDGAIEADERVSV